MKIKIATFLFIIVLFTSCSLQKIALRSTTGLLYHGINAIYQESDLQIAEQAIASDLKLLEGLLEADPQNKDILLLLTQGYASYSLGFVEEESSDRAKLFYLRARDYGLRLLKFSSPFKNGIPQTESEFLQKTKLLQRKDIPALFWTAFAWGGWINLSKDNPEAIFDLGKINGMMGKVLEIDEGYFFGAAHLYFGSVAGALPKMLGGNPEKAKEHFQKAVNLTNGNFVLTYIYFARYYAQPLLDDKLFDEYLQKVFDAPTEILPGYELITSIAKAKAKNLQSQKEDLF